MTLGAAFWDDLFGEAESRPLRTGPGYGPLAPPDEHGIRLPDGFRSRIVARGNEPVPGTDYRWHIASDGMAAFPREDGGFVLVSNSETLEGGASALRFARDGRVEDAYRILSGTSQNCSGGGTPWGTWLSCEEVDDGRVWECDPGGRRRAVVHPAMGVFKHEAAAVDPRDRRVYLTEDLEKGGLYRYTPTDWPDLSKGRLEIARAEGAPSSGSSCPIRSPAARTRAARSPARYSSSAARGSGSTGTRSTSRPRWTTASTPTTPGASASR